jgi:hypothetical protein
VFTIGLVAQTISFTSSSPPSPVVGATYLPAATGGGSGNPVTFSIDHSSASVCSISSGTVTFNAVGNCLIDADQAGNSSYAAATELTQTVAVAAIPQAITFTTTAPTGATVQGTYSLAATGGGSGNPVTFSIDSGSTSVCSYGAGVVTFTAAGTCIVDADQAGTAAYGAAVEVSQTIAVGVIAQTVAFTNIVPTGATFGGTYVPLATGGGSGNPVTLAIDPSATSVCSLSGGIVSFTGVGDCVVDAHQLGNASYAAAAEVQQTVTVGPGSQAITFTSTVPTGATVGGTYLPAATGGGTGNPVTFSIDSGSTSVCSYGAGVVSFTGAGNCVVDANQAGNTEYAGAPQVAQTIVVSLVAQTITFTSSPPSSPIIGGAYVPEASGGGSGNPVTFSIDPGSTSVCSISSGIVSFGAVGNCVVDADQAGNSTYAGATEVSQTMSVGTIPQTITFTSSAPTAAIVGATYSPTATGGGSGNPVTFSIDSGSTSVCSYSAGVVTFTGAGSCLVDADQAGNATYAAAVELPQTIAVGVIAQAITFTGTTPAGATVDGTYVPTATGGGSGNPVTFNVGSGSASVCSINAGRVTFTAVGNCVIDANQAGNSNYGDAPQVSQTIPVGLIAQTITFTSLPGAPVVGGTYDPAATGGGSGNPETFSIDNASIAVCSFSLGTVTFNAVGNCTIDAHQSGNSTYSAGTEATQTMAVAAIPQTVIFTTTPPNGATVEGTYSPAATGGGSGNQVTFSIDGGSMSVCSLNASSVTFTAVGNCVVDANQTGNSDYADAPQAQQTVSVGQAVQAITFITAAPIEPTAGGTYSPVAAGGGSGNAVTFSVDPSATTVCSYSAGIFTFTGAGHCLIDANQAGNADYVDAPQVSQAITIAAIPNGSVPVPVTPGAPQSVPLLEVAVLGAPPAVTPGSTFQLTVAPALGANGGPATRALSFEMVLSLGETVASPLVARSWSCVLSSGHQVLSCTWTAALPLPAGAALPTVSVTIAVASSVSGPLPITVTLFEATDNTGVTATATSGAARAKGRGYTLAGADGGVFNFGGAGFYDSCHSAGVGCGHLEGQVVGVASTPDGRGYWLVARDGGVFAFGDARFLGSCPTGDHPCGRLSSPVVAMAATPDGDGYWLVTVDGAVFAFGDAGHFGSCIGPTTKAGTEPCGRPGAPIVGIAALPDGLGYWLARATGAVYSFGRAKSYRGVPVPSVARLRGSMVGIASTNDGRGYWLAGSDGGVFAFGDAQFLGNTYTAQVEDQLQSPIVGIAAASAAKGYWLAARDGGVFAFQSNGFRGDTYTAGIEGRLVAPVVGIAGTGAPAGVPGS